MMMMIIKELDLTSVGNIFQEDGNMTHCGINLVKLRD